MIRRCRALVFLDHFLELGDSCIVVREKAIQTPLPVTPHHRADRLKQGRHRACADWGVEEHCHMPQAGGRRRGRDHQSFQETTQKRQNAGPNRVGNWECVSRSDEIEVVAEAHRSGGHFGNTKERVDRSCGGARGRNVEAED
jgi:hypothetical protein